MNNDSPRVYDSLKRLGMKATVKQGDGRYPPMVRRAGLTVFCWMRLLRNRRHSPSSRYQMAASRRDIAELAQLQAEILDAVWPRLKPGGTLVLRHLFRTAGRRARSRSRTFYNALRCRARRSREH